MVRRQVYLRPAGVPVGDQRFAYDVPLRHQPPLPRIAAVLPVIAHHEVAGVGVTLGARVSRPLFGYLPDALVAVAVSSASDVRLLQLVSVDQHLARLLDLHRITRRADDALDEVLGRVGGRLEDDDVTAAG